MTYAQSSISEMQLNNRTADQVNAVQQGGQLGEERYNTRFVAGYLTAGEASPLGASGVDLTTTMQPRLLLKGAKGTMRCTGAQRTALMAGRDASNIVCNVLRR